MKEHLNSAEVDASKPYAPKLFRAAVEVMALSHSPYSKFPVGAALLAEDGNIYVGCNIENASYPEGICAETAAIAQMIMNGARRIQQVAVVAEQQTQITPCGGCRQRLSEFADATTHIHLCGSNGVEKTVTLAELLPFTFKL